MLSNASGTEITTISITADATGSITDLTIVNGVAHTAAPTILQSSCVGKLYVPQGGSQTNSGHYIVGRYYWNYKQMMTFSKRYTWVLQLGQGKDYDVISFLVLILQMIYLIQKEINIHLFILKILLINGLIVLTLQGVIFGKEN